MCMLRCRESGYVDMITCVLVKITEKRTVDTSSKTIITRSNPADFPSAVRQQLSNIQTVVHSELQHEASINITCSKCGRKEVKYSQVQLRSADEGSTIFYNCECGHKYVLVCGKMKSANGMADGLRTINSYENIIYKTICDTCVGPSTLVPCTQAQLGVSMTSQLKPLRPLESEHTQSVPTFQTGPCLELR